MGTLHPLFTESQQAKFETDGYVRLGKILPESQLQAMRDRLDGMFFRQPLPPVLLQRIALDMFIDLITLTHASGVAELMLGDVVHKGMSFQLDLGGQAADSSPSMSETTVGVMHPSLAHRRVNDLELDPIFAEYIRLEVFGAIAAHYYRGAEAVSVFRVFMMNKPREQGTPLNWHQDVGRGWGIDTLPTMTTWLALDPATIASGAMQLVRGSHRRGVLNAGHFVDEGTLSQFSPNAIVDLECEAGEVILLHNLTLHRSGVNTTTKPRRAISVAYVDARSRYLQGGSIGGEIRGAKDAAKPRPHGASAMVAGQFPVVFRLSGSATGSVSTNAQRQHKI